MNIPLTKTELICPYCKTYLIRYKLWDELFFCECHPLKNYKGINQRVFTWRITYNENTKIIQWDYIPKNKDKWIKASNIPLKKQVFTFR